VTGAPDGELDSAAGKRRRCAETDKGQHAGERADAATDETECPDLADFAAPV
jgi:hypothetical protein